MMGAGKTARAIKIVNLRHVLTHVPIEKRIVIRKNVSYVKIINCTALIHVALNL